MVAGASFGWTGMSLFVAGTEPARTGRWLIAGPAMMALGLLGVALLMPRQPPTVFPAIALVGAVQRTFGQLGFHLHDGLCVGCGLSLRLAVENKHLGDVLLELLA